MNKRVDGALESGIVLSMTLAFALSIVADRALAGDAGSDNQQAPVYDQYGRVPETATDKDLALPDPVLDRTWPLPEPGSRDDHHAKLVPEEDETDPFREDDTDKPAPADAPPPSADAWKAAVAAAAAVGRKAAAAAEAATPPVAAPGDPATIDPLNQGNAEPLPSPLDEDDKKFEHESRDPEEW